MILKDFLDNPIGKGDASVNVNIISQALSNKYEVYKKNKDKKIKMKVFRQPLKDVYWIWLEMPSETKRDNTYDIVYTFSNPDPKIRTSLGIGKFDIQVFANTPSFAYTYAYVYNKNGLLISSLASKLGNVFLSKEPSVRNRNQVLLFDKYIYFGARYILESKVLNRAIADVQSMKYDQKSFNANIRTLETIMEEYRVAEDKLKGKTKKQKKEEKKSRKSSDVGNVQRKDGDTKKGVKIVSKNAARKSNVTKKKSTISKR